MDLYFYKLLYTSMILIVISSFDLAYNLETLILLLSYTLYFIYSFIFNLYYSLVVTKLTIKIANIKIL